MWLTGATAVSTFHASMCCLVVPSTSNAGTSEERLSAWRFSLSLQATSFGSASTIRPRKRRAPRSKGSPAIAMARAPPAKNTGRCGLNFVLGVMHIPLTRWPGHSLHVPVGLELSPEAPQALQRNVPYRSPQSRWPGTSSISWPSRRPDAPSRAWLMVVMLPRTMSVGCPRPSISWGASPSAPSSTRCRPHLPPSVAVPPRKKGVLIGSPKTLAQTATGWVSHPSEAGAEIQAGDGLWHAVLPGRLVRVVVLRRPGTSAPTQPGQHKPPPALEAFLPPTLP